MPTRKIRRGVLKNNLKTEQENFDGLSSKSLIDLLAVVQETRTALLPVNLDEYGDAVGSGLSGIVRQTRLTDSDFLVFKRGIPSRTLRDDVNAQDWASLMREVVILRHGLIKSSPRYVKLLGIAFSVEAATDTLWQTWPFLIMFKSPHGDLKSFLTSGVEISESERLRILSHIAESIHTLHKAGIAHGDVKLENFLVHHLATGELSCIMSDFGSSIICGERRFHTTSKPWSPPELESRREQVGFEDLTQADLYAFGLMSLHVMLSPNVLESLGLCSLLQLTPTAQKPIQVIVGGAEDQEIEDTSSWDPSLSKILRALETSNSAQHLKLLLASIVKSTIGQSVGFRRMPWDEMLPVVGKYLSDGVDFDETITRGDDSIQSHENHIHFKIEVKLAIFDGLDYLLKQAIVRDLVQKSIESSCALCRQACSNSLEFCHTIGFGVASDSTTSNCFEDAGKEQGDLRKLIERANQCYPDSMQAEQQQRELVGQNLDYIPGENRHVSWERTGRVDDAEASLKREILIRSQVFGEYSLCLTVLQKELVVLLNDRRKLDEAELVRSQLENVLLKTVGSSSKDTLHAQIFKANIHESRGDIHEAASILTDMHPDIISIFGPEDLITIRVEQKLGWLFYKLREYDQSRKLLERVVQARTRSLGATHDNTIRAQFLLRSVLTQQFRFTEAEAVLTAIQLSYGNTLEGDNVKRRHLCLVWAIHYTAAGMLQEAKEKAAQAQKASEMLKHVNDTEFELDLMTTMSAIHGAIGEFLEQETLLRHIITIEDAKRIETTESWETRCRLAICLENQGRVMDAAVVADKVLGACGVSVKRDPESVTTCTYILARAFFEADRFQEAEETYRGLWHILGKDFGWQHVMTIRAGIALGRYLVLLAQQDPRKIDDAIDVWELVLKFILQRSSDVRDDFPGLPDTAPFLIWQFLIDHYSTRAEDRGKDDRLQERVADHEKAKKCCEDAIAWCLQQDDDFGDLISQFRERLEGIKGRLQYT